MRESFRVTACARLQGGGQKKNLKKSLPVELCYSQLYHYMRLSGTQDA
jgi:hypothetical protein